MKLTFNITYNTRLGGEIKIHGRKNGKDFLLPLTTTDGKSWRAELDLEQPTHIIYNYAFYENGALKRKEWALLPREINATTDTALFDAWRDLPPLSWLCSSAFSNVLNRRPLGAKQTKNFARSLYLTAYAPQVKKGQKLLLCTNQAAYDNWEVSKATEAIETSTNIFSAELDTQKINFPLEYKFVIQDGQNFIWQNGNNFILPALPQTDASAIFINGAQPYFEQKPQRAAGVVLPVFSIRTKNSFGAGDFGDIKLLADWASKTGQKVIQLLPVNDTTITKTWRDSYPYNSISVYALHPMYIDLNALPLIKDDAYTKLQQQLNALETVDYETVNKAKHKYIYEAFLREGAAVFASKDFMDFYVKNISWLKPYAVFSHLRDIYGGADFRKWPKYNIFNKKEVDALCTPAYKGYGKISYYYYMQYKLHAQLLEAANYARAKGVFLKGDIPIGVSPDSVDVWTEPHYFNTSAQAGAPPDAFSANGQNWGFPTYNWDEMAKNGYTWWIKRFKKMAEYFDAYRVDHILGFFRIWQIPKDSVHGLLGRFEPALPMSKDEILSYGFWFKDHDLKPFINDDIVDRLFGDNAPAVKGQYLRLKDNGLYEMQAAYNTQRKVEAAFADLKDEEALRLKEGLYRLISNVLFVADGKKAGFYHPRISANTDLAFEYLDAGQKAAYNNLYNNYFYHRQNDFWGQKALQKLPALTQSTRMLACAEDLGMIPACVESVMAQLQLLSLEIQRMPKTLGLTFADTTKYPYLSVCTISTHDMAPLRQWWTEDEKLTQKFYNEVLDRQGTAPKEASPDICQQIINMHLSSPSMLCVLAWQDWMSIDGVLRKQDGQSERINIPADPQHYWRYRMHKNVEELLEQHSFNDNIRHAIEQSGRL